MTEKTTLEELMEDIRAMEYKLRLLKSKDITINLPLYVLGIRSGCNCTLIYLFPRAQSADVSSSRVSVSCMLH